MTRTLFIVNPVAGRGAALKAWKRIEKQVAATPGAEVVHPTSYEDTRRIAAEAARTGIERVVAIGGDGTLDAVAGELAHSETTLGMIPAGTGNDFCKTTGIPLDPEAALPIAIGPHTRRIDLGLAANERHFLNVAGAGFDAEVAAVVMQYPKGLGGTLPYLMGAITTIFRYRPLHVTITVDDQRYEGPITLAAVANGSQYGGGMRIAPKARRDDGVFDVCIADQLNRAELLSLLPRVYTGSHVHHPKVRFLAGRHVRIEAQGRIHAHADGDLLRSSDLTFQLLCGALKVALPQIT